MAFGLEDAEIQNLLVAYGRRMQNISRFLIRSAEWKKFAYHNPEKSDFIEDLLNSDN
jgi:hypothetical protein